MENLKLYDKNDDIYIMYLSELKNMLYSDKNISDESKNIIRNIIKNKIKNSLIEIESSSSEEIESEEIESKEKKNNINQDDNTEFNYDIESEESNTDYKDEIKKLYDRSDRKGENERFTQTSQKLFDRMFSHAQIINNSYSSGNTQKISKPFVTDNPGRTKLGERKYIGKK
jgi:hypothetical protein